MTEQEKIEEMASNVESALHNHCRMFISCDCNDCEFLKYRTPKTDCQGMCIAKNLYNENYRKIDDDCVVITKAELKQRELKAVKDMAKKFADLVEFHSVATRDENGFEMFSISALGLKEILREDFGVEV